MIYVVRKANNTNFCTTTFLVYHVVQAHHHHLINDTIPTFFIIRVSFYCLYTSFMITKKIMVYALSTKDNKK